MAPLPVRVVGAVLALLISPPRSPEKQPAVRAASRADDTVNPVIGDASFVAFFGRPPGPDDPERLRVAAHLAYAEAWLRAADVGDLPAALRARRQANLDRLRAYRLAGQFPDGEEPAPGWRPTFIDDRGRRCAVAALLEQSEGGSSTAFAIDRQFHHAYVADIADATFDAWVAASGLTRDELEVLQPRYLHRPPLFSEGGVQLEWAARVQLMQLMQRIDSADASPPDRLGGLAATLRLASANPLLARWFAAVDGELGRFSAQPIVYGAALRAGAAWIWKSWDQRWSHDLGVSVGAGVNGAPGLLPAALTAPIDLYWRYDQIIPFAGYEPRKNGLALQLRGRAEPVVLGRPRTLLWSAAIDLMWVSLSSSRRDLRFSVIARDLAGATWIGGELGIGFRSPATLVAGTDIN